MRAEVLCVGTELLIGQVVNTNATWLGRELAALGLAVCWNTTVGDNAGRLDDALRRAAGRAEVVVVTGGLGPTPDDITVEALARLAGEGLVERPEALAHLEAWFAARRRPMSPSNLKQATFPPSVELIPNPTGTALGAALRHDGAWVLAFPGVPAELEAMWQAWARPRLAALGGGTIRSVLLRYVGIGESVLAEQVADLLDGANPSVAPYAGDGEVHLRVTARAADEAAAEAAMAPVLTRLRAIAPYYYGEGEVTLPAAVGARLLEAGQTVATAESCTGGLLASRLTDVPGSSRWMRGGVVAYMTDVKEAVLGVDPALIEAHGVVSEAVACALAEGARVTLGATWGIGVTGWAGPAPNLEPTEVGLVWFAVAGPDGATALGVRYGAMGRPVVKQRATQGALDLLRRRMDACLRPGA
ncbi:MAG: competence/damage-inducible protein A [Candidatus Sericytochromatia bacterium]|nr:competence/damage-inducible protein A [Candidatus Sericytochromatia bacterium]